MKIYAEKDDGTRVEITEAREIDSNCTAIMFTIGCNMISTVDRHAMERELSDKTGKQCVVLDARFESAILIK